MTIKHFLLETGVTGLVWMMNLDRQHRMSLSMLERLFPVQRIDHDGIEYAFHVPNRMVDVRARTLLTKEPDVIAWIDSFGRGEILFDVGANIGLFSIYAAKRGHRVIAFEPESKNYALLNTNVAINGLQEQIAAFSVALSDRDAADHFYLADLQAGGAEHNLGAPMNWRHVPFTPGYRQSVVSFSVDSFIKLLPDSFPTHIKIDVDGIEGRILRGAASTLRDPRLKSVLVEMNEDLEADRQAVEMVQTCGFRIESKAHLYQEGFEHNVYNYVFRR
jgi:FkbM family methyltransferase